MFTLSCDSDIVVQGFIYGRDEAEHFPPPLHALYPFHDL